MYLKWANADFIPVFGVEHCGPKFGRFFTRVKYSSSKLINDIVSKVLAQVCCEV